MRQAPKIQELQEDDERFFVPEWLQQVKAEDDLAIQEMTPEETEAYYREKAASGPDSADGECANP
jgi:hypothetical protein